MSIQVRVTITDTDRTDGIQQQLADRVVTADSQRTVEEAVDKAAERALRDATLYVKALFQEPRRMAQLFTADIEKL